MAHRVAAPEQRAPVKKSRATRKRNGDATVESTAVAPVRVRKARSAKSRHKEAPH